MKAVSIFCFFSINEILIYLISFLVFVDEKKRFFFIEKLQVFGGGAILEHEMSKLLTNYLSLSMCVSRAKITRYLRFFLIYF